MSLIYSDDAPEPAHAASELGDEDERHAEVSPLFKGLLWAFALTAACVVAAHLIARFWP